MTEKFNRRHDNILCDIRNLERNPMFHRHNFVHFEIIEKNASGCPVNKSYYNITRDGLMFLIMGLPRKSLTTGNLLVLFFNE